MPKLNVKLDYNKEYNIIDIIKLGLKDDFIIINQSINEEDCESIDQLIIIEYLDKLADYLVKQYHIIKKIYNDNFSIEPEFDYKKFIRCENVIMGAGQCGEINNIKIYNINQKQLTKLKDLFDKLNENYVSSEDNSGSDSE